SWVNPVTLVPQPLPGLVHNPVVSADGTLIGATFDEDTAVPAANYGGGTNGVVFDAIDRIAHTQTRFVDNDLTYHVQDKLKLHWRIGYTDAVGATDQQPFWETNAPTGFTYSLAQGVPQVHFTNINPATDATPMSLGWASNNTFVNNDNEFYTFADA